jgi:hypothetical protein
MLGLIKRLSLSPRVNTEVICKNKIKATWLDKRNGPGVSRSGIGRKRDGVSQTARHGVAVWSTVPYHNQIGKPTVPGKWLTVAQFVPGYEICIMCGICSNGLGRKGTGLTPKECHAAEGASRTTGGFTLRRESRLPP